MKPHANGGLHADEKLHAAGMMYGWKLQAARKF